MADSSIPKSPSKLAHLVLKTTPSNFHAMVDSYTKVLGATIVFANKRLCFLSYDDEHHRIAIARIPGTTPKQHGSAGLDHSAFSYDTPEALLLSYKSRKELGILPVWCVNHGPTTSIYYADPDEDRVETQVDKFVTASEATKFMMSEKYRIKPIGADFDPEEWLRKLECGIKPEVLKTRIEAGPRMMSI
jgi:catechol-2,3-dioxygenase